MEILRYSHFPPEPLWEEGEEGYHAKDRILTGVFATIALKAGKKHSGGRHHFLVLPGTWKNTGGILTASN